VSSVSIELLIWFTLSQGHYNNPCPPVLLRFATPGLPGLLNRLPYRVSPKLHPGLASGLTVVAHFHFVLHPGGCRPLHVVLLLFKAHLAGPKCERSDVPWSKPRRPRILGNRDIFCSVRLACPLILVPELECGRKYPSHREW